MRTWITHHLELILLGLSVVFVAILVAYYLVVIQLLGHQLDSALNTSGASGPPNTFNLEAASKLDLRGLSTAPGSVLPTSSLPSILPTTASSTTTTTSSAAPSSTTTTSSSHSTTTSAAATTTPL